MKGQVVFITGSSSGIGRETAYRFAQAGAKLVLTYNHGKKRGEEASTRADTVSERLYPDSYRDTSEVVSTENER